MTDRLPSDDVLIGEHYYILASSVAADLPKLVLKHDDAFLVATGAATFQTFPASSASTSPTRAFSRCWSCGCTACAASR